MTDIKTISFLLVRLGCSISYKGFRYLAEIIKRACDDESVIYNLSNEVYMTIAEENGTKATNVERDVRTVIKRQWEQHSTLLKKMSLTPIEYQPTVKEFISLIVCHLKYDPDFNAYAT